MILQIGAGGMGEVYKARDPKLNRMVAIKVLPPSLAEDPGLLARFEREARAVAALSHPNVMGIFDLGTEHGITYAVMELLEGENLRDKLRAGPLAARRVVEIAVELAGGLGAAHSQGIIHRDIKPENIFITREGRVKVLDFGLSKQAGRARPETETQSLVQATEAGMVLGTAGYMSPEQVRGEAVDHRSDIFSFGVVLHEMLSGQRPFQGDTPVQTMAAILDQDPPELASSRGPLPAGLERLVAHCLEKRPEARFQAMSDVAYNLQNLGTFSSGGPAPAAPAPARRAGRAAAALAGAGLLLAALAVLWLTGLAHLGREVRIPSFTRITHTPGTVESAFFGPDGRTIYFSERIQGGAPELFVLHPGGSEPRAMGIQDALLLGVSATGDLALLRQPRGYVGTLYRGMLAQAGADGGPVKEVQENVVAAVWDGPGFVTLADSKMEKLRLEFAGRVLVDGNPYITNLRMLRLSPDGRTLAFVRGDSVSRTEIVACDRQGRQKVIFTKVGDAMGDTFTGMAWGPDGELWYSEVLGDQTAIWSLTLGGARRMLWRGEGTKALMDASRDGRMLLADQQVRRGVLLQKPGEAQFKDVSIASATEALGFSADGRALLLLESPIPNGGTPQDQIYLWRQETGSATRVGTGQALALSPDGRWVNMQLSGFAPQDVDPAVGAALREAGLDPKAVLDPVAPAPYELFLPTGAGRPFAIALPRRLDNPWTASLTADGTRVAFTAEEKGVFNWYVMDRQGGNLKVLQPPGFGNNTAGLDPVAPDGTRLVAFSNYVYVLVPLDGGPARTIPNWNKDEVPIAWSRDSRSLFVRNRGLATVIMRLDLATGARRTVYTYAPADPSGMLPLRGVMTANDGQLFALNYVRQLSNLYLAEGIR